MSLGLMLLVLFAAALHAGWNAIVKSSRDKSSDVVLVAVAAALIALATLPFVGIPATASWPYLAASVGIHQLYFALVALAYRHGDLSYAYPLMRGSAPLITACAATLVVGEALRPGGYLGVLLLSGYMGGAIATHMQHGESYIGPSIFLALIWVAGYLRHPELLQSFLWQKLDIAPDFPELRPCLEFWSRNIDGKLHSVRIAQARPLAA